MYVSEVQGESKVWGLFLFFPYGYPLGQELFSPPLNYIVTFVKN